MARFALALAFCLPVMAADWSPRAAAEYLDGRQKEWAAWAGSNLADGNKCVSCHTGLTYLLARPALRSVLRESQPTEYEKAVVAGLEKRVSKRAPLDLYPKAKEPHVSEEAAVESIFAALFVKSPEAFDRMWSLQAPSGAWLWNSFELDPWETPESAYFGAALAAMAIRGMPARAESTKLKQYLEREFAGQPLHNRLMAIWAGAASATGRKSAIDELWGKQAADGSWTLEALGPWRKHEKAVPAVGPNAYATAFAAAALRRADVADPRLAKAREWLKGHQDAKGYWDAVSMNKVYAEGSMMAGFMRDAATAFAVVALAND